jgi:hypothetical protein
MSKCYAYFTHCNGDLNRKLISDIKLNNMMTKHRPKNNTAIACTNLYTYVDHVTENDTWTNRNCEINSQQTARQRKNQGIQPDS